MPLNDSRDDSREIGMLRDYWVKCLRESGTMAAKTEPYRLLRSGAWRHADKLLRSKLSGSRLIEITHSVVTACLERGSAPNFPGLLIKACGNAGLRLRDNMLRNKPGKFQPAAIG
jgi:hypothetical protein